MNEYHHLKIQHWINTFANRLLITSCMHSISIIEAIIIVLLGLWLLGNIIYAVWNRRMGRFTYYRDLFRWLSAYQLFSDTPRAYQLLYRDRLTDDTVTGWQLVRLTPAWKPWHLIWYPQKQVPLTIYSIVDDLAVGLQKRRDSVALEKIQERFMYRVLLLYVGRFPPATGATNRQFRIGQGGQDLFTSDFHPL